MDLPLVFIMFTAVVCSIKADPSSTVRVMRHHDGSQTVYRQNLGDRTLVKKKIGANGTLQLSSHYHLDDAGTPRSGKIYDAKGTLLYKISFAFSVQTDRLVAERMFDAHRIDPNTGRPLLVSETRYTYDDHGKRSQPVTRTFIAGKTAEQHFGGR